MAQENIAGGTIGGVVASFIPEKGGFINGDDGESYYVHVNEILGNQALATGQRVTFVQTSSPKRKKAKKVVPGLAPTSMVRKTPPATRQAQPSSWAAAVEGCRTGVQSIKGMTV